MPEHGRRLRHRGGAVGDRPGDAEVHDLDLAGAAEHDVAGLDVAVDDPVPVRVVERRQRALGDLDGALRGEPVAGLHQLAQRRAVDVLHDDVGDRHTGHVGLAGVVHGDDVRVVQRRGGVRLTAEAGHERGVPGEVRAQQLDRDAAAQAQVAALVDLGHAATTDDLAELVALAEPSLVHRALLRSVAHRLPPIIAGPGLIGGAPLPSQPWPPARPAPRRRCRCSSGSPRR